MSSKKKAAKGEPSSNGPVLEAKHFAGSENSSDVSDNQMNHESSETSVGGLEDHASSGSETGSNTRYGVTQLELSDDQISSSTVPDMSRSSPTSIGTFDARAGKFGRPCLYVWLWKRHI